MKTLKLNLIWALLLFSCAKEQPPQVPPPDILVFQTKAEEVPIHREYVGQVYGFKDIAIRARVEGYLEGIHFKEGSEIEKGALLYTLESQPFEADVAAKMSTVAAAKTQSVKAESDLNRIRPLAENKAVSESDLDAAVAEYEASVEMVKATEAILSASRIQLGYTKIYSPVSGIIGRTKAKVGDFVGREPNPVILNVVSRIDTVLVQFFITETEYLYFARRYLAREAAADPNERRGKLDLILADGSFYEHKGTIDFIDRGVDPATGAILVQASFPNPEEILRPGQFARVKARVQVVKGGILIPQRCVTELQGRFSVYVVDEKNVVHKREIKTGPKIGQFWLVVEGLKGGEKVVYEGLQKVKDGALANPSVHEFKPAESEKQAVENG
ncbi:MAG: efflux RND transporter periplasmic adaptor subunit [Planctomycetota bacterium]|jgi:membrane fusion protein (multidrug efflux system)